MFLVLQNWLPRQLKLGGCSWRSGRADVSSQQKCQGSTLALRAALWGAAAILVILALSWLHQTCLAKCEFTEKSTNKVHL